MHGKAKARRRASDLRRLLLSSMMVVSWKLAQPSSQSLSSQRSCRYQLSTQLLSSEAKDNDMRTKVYLDMKAFACTRKIQASAEAQSQCFGSDGFFVVFGCFKKQTLLGDCCACYPRNAGRSLGSALSMPFTSGGRMDYALPFLGRKKRFASCCFSAGLLPLLERCRWSDYEAAQKAGSRSV